MKCIQFSVNGEVVRVSDHVAQEMIRKVPGTRFISKEVWKHQGRRYFVVPREAKI